MKARRLFFVPPGFPILTPIKYIPHIHNGQRKLRRSPRLPKLTNVQLEEVDDWVK